MWAVVVVITVTILGMILMAICGIIGLTLNIKGHSKTEIECIVKLILLYGFLTILLRAGVFIIWGV